MNQEDILYLCIALCCFVLFCSLCVFFWFCFVFHFFPSSVYSFGKDLMTLKSLNTENEKHLYTRNNMTTAAFFVSKVSPGFWKGRLLCVPPRVGSLASGCPALLDSATLHQFTVGKVFFNSALKSTLCGFFSPFDVTVWS